jgi:hypothetical protein
LPQESHCTTHASLFHAAGMPCGSSQSHTVRYIPRHWRDLHAYSCRIIVVWTFWSTREFHTDLVSTSQSKIPATLFHLSQQHRAKRQDQRYNDWMHSWRKSSRPLYSISARSVEPRSSKVQDRKHKCVPQKRNILDPRYHIEGVPHHTTTIPPNPDSVSSEHQ